MLTDLFRVLRAITRHPFNRGHRLAAYRRFFSWQVRSRIARGSLEVPFVDGTRLQVRRDQFAATGSIYNGLQEFEDMGFVLHALRPDDLFVDVGANMGVYTVIAAGACGARVVAFEPGDAARAEWEGNVALNGLAGRARCLSVGVSDRATTLRFSVEKNDANHVIVEGDTETPAATIETVTLDAVLADEQPLVLKIDTEGWETPVIRGAAGLLRDHVGAVIVELNGSGAPFGFSDDEPHTLLTAAGFRPFEYDPLARTFTPLPGRNRRLGNTLYLKDAAAFAERVRMAPTHRLHGRAI